MNKIVLGLLLGALLGCIDGLCAALYPQVVAADLATIAPASTFKGLLTGLIAGWYARRTASLGKGILLGLMVGLAFSLAVAAMPDPKTGEHFWWEITLPGAALGAIVGFATQRFGQPAPATHA